MTNEGYPDDEELTKISTWDYKDGFDNLLEYVRSMWQYADCGYWSKSTNQGTNVYEFSTGGWSGNEELISALQENLIFWTFCWVQSRRGGHYIFETKT